MRKALQWQARHTVLSILCVVWMVSFMDRMVMSVAIPYIAADYHLSPLAMGAVLSVFFAGYSISQIPGGLLADLFGVRKVATLAMLWWSVFTALTGAATTLTQMLLARFVFGLGEGVYPACAFKTIATWFPKKERATANAIQFASDPIGSALSPLAVGAVISFWGWRPAFYALVIPGVAMSLLFWIFVHDKPPGPVEIEEQESGASLRILKDPRLLEYFFVLFTFDIAYWGFTTWLPTYLVKARGFSTLQMGVAASLPFFAGSLGSFLGGWTSERYFSNTRRTPIIASQLMSAVLLSLTFTANSTALLLIYQTLAGLSLNFFFTAFWALPMNTVPKRLMGVTSGFINMAGQIAAFISPTCIGYLVGASEGNYDLSFLFMIVALLLSCVLAFTLPNKLAIHQDEPVHG